MAASTPEGLQTKIAFKAGSTTTFLFHCGSFLVVVFAVILFFSVFLFLIVNNDGKVLVYSFPCFIFYISVFKSIIGGCC